MSLYNLREQGKGAGAKPIWPLRLIHGTIDSINFFLPEERNMYCFQIAKADDHFKNHKALGQQLKGREINHSEGKEDK